ncbi:MAG: Fic family protein [Bacteriovoracaceae bacterium]|nr:Fic family protein [Bacteriovoracaceae bacterium]
MNPPYKITPLVLNYISEISIILGRLDHLTIGIPEPKLRKKNQIRTIKSTLAIEGNTFTEDQISAILDNKKVLGSQKEIMEVKNAIKLYENMDSFKIDSVKSLLQAHRMLMDNLVESAGKFRSKNVGVLKGQIVKHVAPQPAMVPELVTSLLKWIKSEKELHLLIKGCVVHYEIEFIHPFEDGNGRMGRFWQSLIMSKVSPLFKYLPVESLIEKNQKKYYDTLEKCDKAGDSTSFIEFALKIILEALQEFDSQTKGVAISSKDRIEKAKDHFGKKTFSRKDYMELFKSISSATASRDIKEAVKIKILKKEGEKNQATYSFISVS